MKKIVLLLEIMAVGILLFVACQNNGTGEETSDTAESPATTEGFDAEWYETMGLTEQDRDRIVSGSVPYISKLGGYVGQRVEGNETNWLLRALQDNPYVLGAIENRNEPNRDPIVNQITWYGEFPGAFLYGAASSYKLTRSTELYDMIEKLIADLAALQATNGYLGTYPDEEQFAMKYWDIGAHFFLLQGLLEWHDATGSEAALAIAEKAASAIHRYRCIRQQEISVGQLMVLSPVARLYTITGNSNQRQLMINLSRYTDQTCNFYQGGLDGIDFYKLPIHRWENLFDVQGMYYLAEAMEDESYLTSMMNHWNSLLRTDRHITGGMTTGETTVGSAFTDGSIETCGSILWEDLSATCYHVTKDPKIIDELELTFYNAILGAQLPDGSMWTYDTPREGRKIPSNEELSWQTTTGSRDFNCCSANSARGIGLLHKWIAYTDDEGLRVNYYGEGSYLTSTPGGHVIKITQETVYPQNGAVTLTMELEATERFALMLRIPAWAKGTKVWVNGEAIETVTAGEYLALEREWTSNDVVTMDIAMNIRRGQGELKYKSHSYFYYGPLLLAVDEAHNPGWNRVKPVFDGDSLVFTRGETKSDELIVLKAKTASGATVTFCDFASAGADKCFYSAWVIVQ